MILVVCTETSVAARSVQDRRAGEDTGEGEGEYVSMDMPSICASLSDVDGGGAGVFGGSIIGCDAVHDGTVIVCIFQELILVAGVLTTLQEEVDEICASYCACCRA